MIMLKRKTLLVWLSEVKFEDDTIQLEPTG